MPLTTKPLQLVFLVGLFVIYFVSQRPICTVYVNDSTGMLYLRTFTALGQRPFVSSQFGGKNPLTDFIFDTVAN